jgi:Flp pilus assembly protein protease CpaA
MSIDLLPLDLLPLLLVLWLLPCAIQDYRHRRVANWLTVPAFFAAWPLALWLGETERVMLTLAVFAGCWVAWQMGGMGAADGKMATCIAAVSPLALGIGTVLLALGFMGMRGWRGQSASLPAGVAFYLGALVAALAAALRIGWSV